MNASVSRFTRRPSVYRREQIPHLVSAQAQQGGLSVRSKRRIRISVRGLQFETFQDTLEQYPETMLGCPNRRLKYYDPVEKQFCLDRDPAIFDSILFYYQSNGILARPECIPESLFKEELEFFGIKTEEDDPIKKTSTTTKILGFMGTSPDDNCSQRAIKLRDNCWLMMEYPRLSLVGNIYGRISISVILLSVLVFCLETVPGLNCLGDITNNTDGKINETRISDNNTTNGSCQLTSSSNCTSLTQTICNVARIWFVIETVLVIFFFMEYLIRILTAPSRCKFVCSFFGLIDAAAIAPYFITIAVYGWRSEMYPQVTSFSVIKIIRLCRVLRVFKLSRYSDGLKLIGHAIKGTWRTLLSLMLCVLMAVILLSSFFFYAEEDSGVVDSILDSFYWAIITMTTVGYGDVVPKTIMGKLTASGCMVFGIVLLLILPLPVFVTHFSKLYEQHVGKKTRAQRNLKIGSPTLIEKLMAK